MTQVEGVVDESWEFRRLRLPPGVSRRTATTQLSINAELAGWELSNVRLYSDGTRRVWLKRRRRPTLVGLPGVIV